MENISFKSNYVVTVSFEDGKLIVHGGMEERRKKKLLFLCEKYTPKEGVQIESY